jgi:hypothetical protein
MVLVNTTKGEMDITLLEKKEGSIDNDHEVTSWVEYWLEGELVHRSVNVHIKKNVLASGIAAAIG